MQVPITAGNLTKIIPFLSDINVCHAWNLTNGSANNVAVEGSGIYVAVIDDGVDTRHQDLAMRMNGSVVYGYDPVHNPLVGPPNPPVGSLIYNPLTDPGCPDNNHTSTCIAATYHGTCVAGVISAKRNNVYPNSNPMGMVGVAPQALLMPVHAFWRSTPCTPATQTTTTTQILADALEWSVNHDADVINNSWGWLVYGVTSKVGSALIEDQIQYAVDYGRGGNVATQTHGKGCVVVFATGNQNWQEISWPASNSNVIAVGASNMCNERKGAGPFPNNPLNPIPICPDVMGPSCDAWEGWGSNYGPGASFVDANNQPLNTSGSLSVVAPGVEITSTNRDPYVPPYYGNYMPHLGGTSVAAPHVSGVAALMLSVNPCLEWQEVRALIQASTDQVNPITPKYTYTSGWNNEMGYGRVNAGDAVTLAYDLYKQATTETGARTYKSAHNIYAGASVTNIYKYYFPTPANYVVSNTARINFFAPDNNSVNLLPGFEAVYNSNFNAEIVNDVCDNHHFHMKQGAENMPDQSLEHFTKNRSNAAQEITIYPNPVSDQLNVSFFLAEDEKVSFAVSNMLGQKISEPIIREFGPGEHRHTISTSNLVPGVYTITIRTKKGTDQFKFTRQ
jgi:subtilisin family serine protease